MTRMATGLLLIIPSLAMAQPANITNGQVRERPVTAFAREFDALVEAQQGPAWIGYAVPAASREARSCCGDWNDGCCAGCRLESERNITISGGSGRQPIPLEGSSHVSVLYRVEQKAIGKIRFYSADCTLDAGGLTVHWLTGVRPAESVALLERLATAERDDRMRAKSDSAVGALANHADPAADAALDRLLDPKQAESVRRKAVFWISAARGQRGLDRLFTIARRDESGKIRGEAIFWIGQKAGQKAAALIREAVDQDPELEVKKKAVFALSQLPAREGVPLLINVARTHKQPEVRRQAMFWLGQSKDPRALDFFAEVLK
jgi:hypothetical protein